MEEIKKLLSNSESSFKAITVRISQLDEERSKLFQEYLRFEGEIRILRKIISNEEVSESGGNDSRKAV